MTRTMLALFALLAAATSLAQAPAGAGGGMPANDVIFERNDANEDGEITQAEAQEAGTQLGQLFATFDLDGDGKVVAEELDTMRQQLASGGGFGARGGAGAGGGGPAGGAAAAQADDDDDDDAAADDDEDDEDDDD